MDNLPIECGARMSRDTTKHHHQRLLLRLRLGDALIQIVINPIRIIAHLLDVLTHLLLTLVGGEREGSEK